MSNQEMIRAYNEIIESLKPLLDHRLRAVAMRAQIQIDRCRRSIRELTENPF